MQTISKKRVPMENTVQSSLRNRGKIWKPIEQGLDLFFKSFLQDESLLFACPTNCPFCLTKWCFLKEIKFNKQSFFIKKVNERDLFHILLEFSKNLNMYVSSKVLKILW